MTPSIDLVLGIRPDIIRASRIIALLDQDPRAQLRFVWSGQHYSDNLKDVFFRDLGVRRPDLELGCGAATDGEIVGQLIARLGDVLASEPPQAVIFLGDTNTVAGAIAAAQLDIPIIHIEGCMRSYDWRMPEEKYRTMIDHLADVIYTYLPEYRDNGLVEGIAEGRIVVTGNPIVDIIEAHYPTIQRTHARSVLRRHSLEPRGFALMTSHRRENVEDQRSLREVVALAASIPHPVVFPASYRTQKNIAAFQIAVPNNVRMLDPIGYADFLGLLGECRYALTDSGTVVEEACVLSVPSIQMRRATERPQVYAVGASVRFDPADSHSECDRNRIVERVEALVGAHWRHPFGDGRASERIVADILHRMETGGLRTHGLDPRVPRVKRAMYGDER